VLLLKIPVGEYSAGK